MRHKGKSFGQVPPRQQSSRQDFTRGSWVRSSSRFMPASLACAVPDLPYLRRLMPNSGHKYPAAPDLNSQPVLPEDSCRVRRAEALPFVSHSFVRPPVDTSSSGTNCRGRLHIIVHLIPQKQWISGSLGNYLYQGKNLLTWLSSSDSGQRASFLILYYLNLLIKDGKPIIDLAIELQGHGTRKNSCKNRLPVFL